MLMVERLVTIALRYRLVGPKEKMILVSSIEKPIREGYTFAGWEDGISGVEFAKIQLKFSRLGRQFPNLKHKNNASSDALFFCVFCSVVTFIFQLFQIYLLFRLCFLLFFFFSSRSKYKHPVNAIATNPTKPYIQVPSEPVIGIKNT